MVSPSSEQKLNVAVLMGGQSAEAEVSRNSAAQVAQALTTCGHSAHTIEVDHQLAQNLLKQSPQVVFPALHGPPGEDGTVQGFLEMLNLPFVGSGVRASALAMDKNVAKNIFRLHNLPVADDCVVSQHVLTRQLAAELEAESQTETATEQPNLHKQAEKIRDQLGARVVIKPLNQGSAIGVTPLPNGGDISSALHQALQYGDCLVEPFIFGREITVGVLETDDGEVVHPVIEIKTGEDEWYDYENRYAPGQSEHIVPAQLDQATQEKLQEIALTAHRALGMRDLSRADFIVDDNNKIILLEVNSLPGMTPTSLYPDGAKYLGYDFPSLIDHLVRRAYARR